MDRRRHRHRETFGETYSEDHIRNILNRIGIVVDQETKTNFLAFCPFHGNTDTPAFSVDKETGRYICFNHACDAHGGLYSLIEKTTDIKRAEIPRFILKAKRGSVSYRERRARAKEKYEWPSMPMEDVDRLVEDFWNYSPAIDYMMGERGFEESTLRHFKIGYSSTNDMVVTPMFDVMGNGIGVIGRSIVGKRFKNSYKLPRGQTLWNIHNAKKHSSCIIVEANFDGMRVHEAGFPNVVAVLGGHFSDEHADQLEKYFDTIILMVDDDDPAEHTYENCKKCEAAGHDSCIGHNPGRELGEKIASVMSKRGKTVKWAMYDEDIIYPAKDAAAMTKAQVRQCILNAASNFRYHTLMESVV